MGNVFPIGLSLCEKMSEYYKQSVLLSGLCVWVGWGMILQVWLVPVWLCEKDSVFDDLVQTVKMVQLAELLLWRPTSSTKGVLTAHSSLPHCVHPRL